MTAREKKSCPAPLVSSEVTHAALPEGLPEEELAFEIPASVPAARAEEGGWSKLAEPQASALVFESQPVWLYALEREQVQGVTIVGCNGPGRFQRGLESREADP